MRHDDQGQQPLRRATFLPLSRMDGFQMVLTHASDPLPVCRDHLAAVGLLHLRIAQAPLVVVVLLLFLRAQIAWIGVRQRRRLFVRNERREMIFAFELL
jgi:hypothetical protein